MNNIKITYLKVSDLKPYEKNPRRNDEAVDYVANSIKEFGFKVPIIIDENSVIIAGHTRYKASKKLGLKEVPCIVAYDLNEEQVKAFRLADNKVAEKAMWDFGALEEELSDIANIDMSIFDFNLNDDELDFSHDDTDMEVEKKLCKCPKCGHINEEKAFKYYEDTE